MPLVLVALLPLVGPGCGEASNRADVYQEILPVGGLPAGRTHTFRVTLFEYSKYVGGFIEFYEIDGLRNTPTNPYFSPSACDYFGAGRIRGGEFPIEVAGPDGPFVMTVNVVDNGRKLIGRLGEPGGAWEGSGDSIAVDFERTDVRVDRACPVSPYPGP